MGIKNRVTHLGSTGFSQAEQYGDLSFLYTASTIKNSKFNIGDRVVTPDGRVFRYAKAGGTVYSEFGCGSALKTIDVAVAPAQDDGAGVVGSNTVTLTKAATAGVLAGGVIDKDELAGGYIVIGNGSSQHPQMRCIIGNPASASGAASLTVTIDAPLTTAVTVGTTTIETYYNPYVYVTYSSSIAQYSSILGIPAVGATIGQYFWIQTWGCCWVTSNSHTCDSASDRTLYFVANASVVSGADVTYAGSSYQMAGFAIDASSSGSSNAPMIMLQISI